MRTLPHLISQLLQIYNIFLQKSNILPFYSYDGVDRLVTLGSEMVNTFAKVELSFLLIMNIAWTYQVHSMNSDVCICYVSAVSVFPWCLSVRIEKGGLKVKFTIGWGRSYLKYISILIEQLYKTVREIMEMLLRNCLFFVDLSKIIQSLFIRAWMSNVWSSNELWMRGIIWYLSVLDLGYICVWIPQELKLPLEFGNSYPLRITFHREATRDHCNHNACY